METNPGASPLYLTDEELESFNQFWRSLSPADRQDMDEFMRSATSSVATRPFSGRYFPFQAFLMALVIEEHKEIKRLRKKIKELQSPE